MEVSIYEKKKEAYSIADEKKLEMCIPIIKVYNNLAFPLSIICCKEYAKDWFFSNFINIYSYYNEKIGKLELNYDVQFFEDEIYYLNTEKISIASFDVTNKDIIQYIINIIDMNKYLCIFLDEYYIKYSYNYKKNHHNHEFFIYGYSKREAICYCMFYDKSMTYVSKKIEWESIKEAFHSRQLNRDYPIILYSYHEINQWTRPIYRMEIEYVVKVLTDYIEGENFMFSRQNINHLKNNCINKYGINVYDDLINYLLHLNLGKDINLISFYLLYEHKRCMNKRIQYLVCKGINVKNICQEYSHIEKKARIIVNMFIKYIIRKENNMDFTKKIVSYLEEMKKQEIELISELVKIMESEYV